MKKINCFITILFLGYAMHAQVSLNTFVKPALSCATDLEEAKLMQDPHYAILKQQKETQYRNAMIRLRQERASGTEQRNPPVYTFPVVVHIIHTGAELGTEANPSDATVISNINTTSSRFRHTHSGAVDYSTINALYGVDTEIQFCMASTDPDGNYTTGIVRHYDADLGFFEYGDGESVSEYYDTRWPIDQYINLFVIETLSGASGVYFGSADATFYDSGAFWSGLIAHEVGHYFNLRHTFQGGCTNGNCLSNGDAVCDTPPKAEAGFNNAPSCDAPNDGCTTDEDDPSDNNPYRSVADDGIGNQPDMIANYMDYTGSCWDAFTQGQKNRMRDDITMDRVPLTTSSGCNVTTTPGLDAGITLIEINGSACTTVATPTVTLNNYGTATLTAVTITLKADGAILTTYSWTGSLASGASASVVLPDVTLTVGNYVLSAETSVPNGGTDGFFNNDISYKKYAVSGAAALPYAENFESGTFPPAGATLVNSDGSFSWNADTSTALDCSGGTNNAGSVNNYSYNAAGQRDHFRLPTFDLTGFDSATLTFDVAYAPYSAAYSDGLDVEVSNACGPPTVEYSKSGLTLATNNPPAYVTDRFEPACTEWRTETVNLDAYTGSGFTQVIIDLVNITGYGNLLFIDNINLTAVSACPAEITIDYDITSGTYTFSAGDYIIGNSMISGATTNVIFSGSNYVALQAGFEAALGCEFTANTDGCIPLVLNPEFRKEQEQKCEEDGVIKKE